MSTPIPPGGPPGHRPPNSFDPYRLKKNDEDPSQQRDLEPITPGESMGLMALLLQKCLEFLDLLSGEGRSASIDTQVKEHIQAFKTALEILQREDRSEDAVFLNQLSDAWNQLLDDAMRLRRGTSSFAKLHRWIKQIQSYPQNGQYSFGYYLSEYAGHSWLPFPYIELIKDLHKEQAQLICWIEELSNLMRMLSQRVSTK